MELPFAGLHQLCAPMLGRLDALPEPQRDALSVALRPLVRRRARPLPRRRSPRSACWPTSPRSGRCSVSSTTRSGSTAPRAGPRLRRAAAAGRVRRDRVRRSRADRRARAARPAGAGARRAATTRTPARCWRRSIPGRLDERVRDRIVAETRGNPLALLELPRGLHGGASWPAASGCRTSGRCPGRIEESFLRRLDALPEDDAAAVAGRGGRPGRRSARCCGARPGSSGSRPRRATPAHGRGLLEVGAQVRFRHPLVRSAVYRSASAQDRQRAHGVLAEATDAAARTGSARLAPCAGHGGPRRGRRGASSNDPQTERRRAAASRRRPRSWSARPTLTPDPARRADAHSGRGAGQRARPAGSMPRSGCWLRPRPGRWMSSSGPAWISCAPRSPTPRTAGATPRRCCCGPPRRSSRSTPACARDLSRRVGRSRVRRWTGKRRRPARRLAGGAGRPRVRRARRARPICCWTASRCCSPKAAPQRRPCSSGRATAFAGDEVSTEEVLRWGWLAAMAAAVMWDYETCVAVATPAGPARPRCGRPCRARGRREHPRPGRRTGRRLRAGGFAGRRGRGGQRGDGSPRDAVRRLVLARSEASEAEATELIEATITEATASGQGTAVQEARWASAVLANAPGRYEDALAAASWRATTRRSWSSRRGRSCELVEAADRSGKPQLADAALARLAARTDRSDGRLGARARGALAGPAERRRSRRARSTARRSSGWAARGSVPISPAPICSTASGCAARTGGSMHASSCARRTSCSSRWARRGSPNAHAASCWPRARRCASAGRHARRAHPAGGAHRGARPRRADERRDRRPAVPQPSHGRMAPAEGVHQARDQLTHGPPRRTGSVSATR